MEIPDVTAEEMDEYSASWRMIYGDTENVLTRITERFQHQLLLRREDILVEVAEWILWDQEEDEKEHAEDDEFSVMSIFANLAANETAAESAAVSTPEEEMLLDILRELEGGK